ncbi:hypothetical protein ANCCAN_03513 [Ancylostoma caninum]|uniref:Uncharacterized protein n=1 Tax=Ancylostoma caninum TaxID=29170 RepID=A0A368H0Z3_ANCCA|nr:hypothetical protein ANCCAN_03513 [Ancylostoma caninum]
MQEMSERSVLVDTTVTFLARVFSLVIPLWVWLLASFATFASHLAISAVTAHLLQFHVKLWKKGITTYRFIIDQRQKKVENTTFVNKFISQLCCSDCSLVYFRQCQEKPYQLKTKEVSNVY